MDLAQEADFALGGLRVRPSIRQIEREGASETLEPRIMQVLVALARRRGEVVSRDELLAACWGGVAVGEDSINRCIYKLRKLGETSGAFRLETIPRVGYRLMEQAVAAADRRADAASPVAGAKQRALIRGPAAWAAAGAVLAVVLVAGVLLRGAGAATPDVDAVVARVTEAVRRESSSEQSIEQAGQAVRSLGGSQRPEERTAFEALASDDTLHALDVLESLATDLEAQGDKETAASVHRKIGSIAVLADPARMLTSNRKAFVLNPDSLSAFQSLFFANVLRGPQESILFADEVLKDASLTPTMRGWVLAHRAFAEIDWLAETAKGEATLAEITALDPGGDDPVLQASAKWVTALQAYFRNDLRAAGDLAKQSAELWSAVPEKTSNGAELLEVRIQYDRGDWAGAFADASSMFERRSRAGDLLPGSVNGLLCESGIVSGQAAAARPYCAVMQQRSEVHPGMKKLFSALLAAAAGNRQLAASELQDADALLPSGGPMRARALMFEAWIAAQAGEFGEAERLTARAIEPDAVSRYAELWPAFAAMAQRLLGERLVAAGHGKRACAPLGEAERIYTEIGGDAGAEASRSMRLAARCPQK